MYVRSRLIRSRTPIAPLLREPKASSNQESQLLHGHVGEVTEVRDSWLRVRGADGYESWIHPGYTVGAERIDSTEGAQVVPWGWAADANLSLGCRVRRAGGAVIDGGRFDWTSERFADFQPFVARKGSLAFLDRVWREQHINFGTSQAPFHSFLTVLGLDTLGLRMERHVDNALNVARFLQRRPEVKWVAYPGLEIHPFHETAERQFQGKGYGGMLAFALEDQEACFRFINGLELIYHLANLGDCKTLVIHPYSSQYVSFDHETRRSLSVGPDLIRLSIGIEAVADICEDLGQALDRLSSS